MTPIERGDRAKQLLEDQVLKDAFREIREGLVRQLEQVAIGDTDTPHRVALTLQCLQALKTKLGAFAMEIAVDKAKDRDQEFRNKIAKENAAKLALNTRLRKIE